LEKKGNCRARPPKRERTGKITPRSKEKRGRFLPLLGKKKRGGEKPTCPVRGGEKDRRNWGKKRGGGGKRWEISLREKKGGGGGGGLSDSLKKTHGGGSEKRKPPAQIGQEKKGTKKGVPYPADLGKENADRTSEKKKRSILPERERKKVKSGLSRRGGECLLTKGGPPFSKKKASPPGWGTEKKEKRGAFFPEQCSAVGKKAQAPTKGKKKGS